MKIDPTTINPADARQALGAVAEIRAAMKPALRVAVRDAKRRLTIAARDLAAAQRDHLRAMRAETRKRPVFLALDSDKAIDALARAFDAYRSRAASLDYLASEYRRAV